MRDLKELESGSIKKKSDAEKAFDFLEDVLISLGFKLSTKPSGRSKAVSKEYGLCKSSIRKFISSVRIFESSLYCINVKMFLKSNLEYHGTIIWL